MASIINASTSGAGGVITTADASGELQIQTAGATAITVDASQNVDISGILAISGISTKQIIAVYSQQDDGDYTRTSTTNAAFGGTVTITPASADSSFFVFATMTANVEQTGTDNDAYATITACNQLSDGSYTSWNTQSNNIGIINGGTTPTVAGQICVFQSIPPSERYLGNLVVRHFGSLSADGSGDYAATINVLNLSVLAVEYLG